LVISLQKDYLSIKQSLKQEELENINFILIINLNKKRIMKKSLLIALAVFIGFAGIAQFSSNKQSIESVNLTQSTKVAVQGNNNSFLIPKDEGSKENNKNYGIAIGSFDPDGSKASKSNTWPYYTVELLPGNTFTGSWYYYSCSSVYTANLVESPEVNWLMVSPSSFTALPNGLSTKVDFIFSTPTVPGVYTTEVVDLNGGWTTMYITLIVTDKPTQYITEFEEQLFTNEPYNLNKQAKSPPYFFWDTLCDTYYYFDQIEYEFLEYPEKAWFNIQPETFNLLPSDSAKVTYSALFDTPGLDSVLVCLEVDGYTWPRYYRFNFEVSPEPFITISPPNQIMPNLAGTTNFSVASNTEWSVSDDADWFELSTANGSNNGTITASYSNNNSGQQRVATITVSGIGGMPLATATVTQSPDFFYFFNISPENQYVASAAGTTSFTINSNTAWAVLTDATWLSLPTPNGIGDETLIATFAENTSGSQRVAKITATAFGTDIIVTVTQEAACMFSVSPSIQNVLPSAGATTFSVNSNTLWTTTDDADWLTVSPVFELGNGTIFATFSDNLTGIQREATISITACGNNYEVTVVQEPSSVIVNPASFEENLDFGTTVTREMIITNIGEIPLDFNISSEYYQNSNVKSYNPKITNTALPESSKPTELPENIFGIAKSQPGGSSANKAIERTFRYDDGVNYDGIGLTNGGTFQVAAYFPAATMSQYIGMKLSKLEFYIRDIPNFCTVKIYGQGTLNTPGSLLHEQIVDVTSDSWNLFELSGLVPITGEDLWIGYEVTQQVGSYPAGCDAGPAVAGFGDMIYFNGSWNPMSSSGLNYNWNIAGYLEGNWNWLTISPATVTVEPGESANVDVTFNATALANGTYNAEIIINSDDASAPEVIIPTQMTVSGGIPNISISTDFLEFGSVPIIGSTTQTFTVSNTGYDLLEITGTSFSNPDFSLTSVVTIINPGGNRLFEIEFTPSTIGTITVELTISSNDPDQPEITIGLSGTAYYVGPPTVEIGQDEDWICNDGSDYYFGNVIASDYTSINWYSYGTGNFDDPSLLHPTYYPSENDYINGNVYIYVSVNGDYGNAFDDMYLYFDNCLPIEIGLDEDWVCKDGSSYYFGYATSSGYNSINWFTNDGTGYFDDPNQLNPTYYPGVDDYLLGNVTIYAEVNGDYGVVSDSIYLHFIECSSVEIDVEEGWVCNDGSGYYFGDVSASGYNYISWQTSGYGYFDDPYQLHPTYYPSAIDYLFGDVYFQVTVYGEYNTSSDQMYLYFNSCLPIEIGLDEDWGCKDGSGYHFGNATSSGYNSINWFTNDGTGYFDDPNQLKPTYYPSADDYLLGNVTIYAEVNGDYGVASDSIYLHFRECSSVDIGVEEAWVCNDGSGYYFGNATASNYNYINWTAYGSGYFDDPHQLNPTYYPSLEDYINGGVVINVEVNGATWDWDEMYLYFQPSPEVWAGDDATINSGNSFTLSGVSATNYNVLSWSTSGDGVFSNPSILQPTYYPGMSDVLIGHVDLCLNGSSCATVEDCMTLNIINIGMPQISVNPASFEESLAIGASVTREIIIENTGDLPLNFNMRTGSSSKSQTYCDASTTSEDEYIANVLMGSINNSSGWQGGVADYTAIHTEIEAGTSQNVTITNGTQWASDIVYIWVDWNKNFEFEGDDELTILINVGGTGASLTGSVTCPVGQADGDYRMRIRMTYNTAPTPCGNASYGEIEDYTIVVEGGWLTISLTTGTLQPGESASVDVTFDATALANGVHNADIIINSNAVNAPQVVIPAQLTIQTDATQTISISQGWSGISSYLAPTASDVESIFQPILPDLTILQSETGMFWPGQNINTIGFWDTHQGYKIKVANTVELTITGFPENNKTLQLSSGWNLIPVLSECPVDVETLFSGANLVIVKEVAGWRVYWPAMGINSLEYLEPGKAYFVLVSVAGTITFLECNGIKSEVVRDQESFDPIQAGLSGLLPSTLQSIKPTATTHIVGIPSTAIKFMEAGDMIGAFDENGNCYDVSIWQNKPGTITLFENDPTTTIKDGFNENEPLKFRLFRQENGEEYEVEVTFNQTMPNPDMVFVGNGLSAITGIKLLNTSISSFNYQTDVMIIPNPAKDEFSIYFDDNDFEKGMLTIYTIDGRLVKIEGFDFDNKTINISEMRSGIYALKIEYGNKIINKRLIKK